MLLEDERGNVNLIVPPSVYDRSRAVVRAAPLWCGRGASSSAAKGRSTWW